MYIYIYILFLFDQLSFQRRRSHRASPPRRGRRAPSPASASIRRAGPRTPMCHNLHYDDDDVGGGGDDAE